MAEHEVDSTEVAPTVESGTGRRDPAAHEPAAPPAESCTDQHGPAAHEPAAPPVVAAMVELDTLAERDLADHPEIFERIHGQLHASLSAIDDA